MPFNSLSRDHKRDDLNAAAPPVSALSTPSLGITYMSPKQQYGLRASFQLPLSGSLVANAACRLDCRDVDFQLPLSGSLLYYASQGVAEDLCLSTPSLGITSAHSGLITNLFGSTFQLPLSGSPRGDCTRLACRSPLDQPFNSLSRDHVLRLQSNLEALGAFNSLSRDHKGLYERGASDHTVSFNSLSRDHP